MYQDIYKLTLIDDIVLPVTVATELSLNTLEFIPGSAIYGFIASKLYDMNQQQKTLDLFHNGTVRFLDGGLYEDEKGEAVQVPFSLVYDKLDSTKTSYFPETEGWEKMLKEKKQLEKHKGKKFFFNEEVFHEAKVKTTTDFKTTINFETKTAQDAQLFIYKGIQRNQTFLVKVMSNNQDYLQEIKTSLDGQTLNIGRSKSAQYGRAKVVFDKQITKSERAYQGDLKIYCKSRVSFVDEYGDCNLDATIQQFGFKEGTIDWENSHILTSSYSPYNSKRTTRESDRIYLTPGSVIHLKNVGAQEFDPEMKGIGAFRSEGFGEVLCNPTFLKMTEGIVIQKADDKTVNTTEEIPAPTSSLAIELNRRKQVFQSIEQMEKDAMGFRFSGISRSQWKALIQWKPDNANQLIQELEDNLSRGVKKVTWEHKSDKLIKELKAKAEIYDSLDYLRIIASIQIRNKV